MNMFYCYNKELLKGRRYLSVVTVLQVTDTAGCTYAKPSAVLSATYLASPMSMAALKASESLYNYKNSFDGVECSPDLRDPHSEPPLCNFTGLLAGTS